MSWLVLLAFLLSALSTPRPMVRGYVSVSINEARLREYLREVAALRKALGQ